MKRILIILSTAIGLVGGVLALSSINGSSIFRKNVEILAQQAKEKVCFKVVDKNGDPLIGASVQVKGTTRGVMADIDGNVCIEVARGEVLVISYVGYKSVEITYTGPESIRPIVLEEDDEVLDEVI